MAIVRSRFVDLSHTLESGMITYKGLPAPVIGDHLTREASRSIYGPGTEFQIGRIEMVSNTGTYLDTPFHRYADGVDLSGLALESISDLAGVVIRIPASGERAVTPSHFGAIDLRGKAVLVHTGWDVHWRTDQYFTGFPFLTEQSAIFLRDAGVALVGIDSHNIDCTDDGMRPVHTTLLRAGIPIVEHMTNLGALPPSGFRFTAAPPKILGMGSFPVRAHARLDG